MSKERYQWYMGTSEIIDNQTKKFITQDCPELLNEQSKQISDLEAKLAESENKHLLDEKEWQDYCAYKIIEPQIKGCLDREREYKKQLAEKEKELESITESSRVVILSHIEFTENINKNKISFAVEQLEKVKEFYTTPIYDRENPHTEVRVLLQRIDNQIKQLKEMK